MPTQVIHDFVAREQSRSIRSPSVRLRKIGMASSPVGDRRCTEPGKSTDVGGRNEVSIHKFTDFTEL
jgi:hypothetical protein